MFRQAVENLQKILARVAKPSPEELRGRLHVAIRDLPSAEAGAEGRGRGRGLCFQSPIHPAFGAEAPFAPAEA